MDIKINVKMLAYMKIYYYLCNGTLFFTQMKIIMLNENYYVKLTYYLLFIQFDYYLDLF